MTLARSAVLASAFTAGQLFDKLHNVHLTSAGRAIRSSAFILGKSYCVKDDVSLRTILPGTPSEIWLRAVQSLEEHSGSDRLPHWFRQNLSQASIGEWDGSALVVRIPSQLTREWLERKYRTVLEELLCSHSDRNVEIRLEAGPPEKKERPADRSPAPTKEPKTGEVSDAAGSGRAAETSSRSARGASAESIRTRLVDQLNCTPMNPKHRLSTFVAGGSNEFVHKAACCVAESPGKTYNPLFIHGGVGLGKTHILQAIGQEIQERQPDAVVAYLSGEAFTSSFVSAVRERRMEEFRRLYRHIDVWLVDDVQFIASKERTGEEFYHEFNTLHGMDRQVVIGSDRPPQELQILDNRMASRFEAGLVADLSPPGYDTRLAILRQKTETEGTEIPSDVLEMMAKMIRSSVRVLEGALIRILAHASFTSSSINVSMATSLLSRYFDDVERAPIRVETVQRVVCDSLDVSPESLLSKKRDRRSLMARQMAMYLSRELTDCSLEQIGQSFGGKDHSTVAHACRTFKNSLPMDSNLERTTERIRDRIRRTK